MFMLKDMRAPIVSRNEQGIVAIFTVMIIMGVLALLTMGFSNITRQAQRRTLDDQLSTQAFYAAETGINRARQLLSDGTLTADKDDCLGGSDFGYDVDPELGISISCLLVDTTPTNVRIDTVPVGQSRSFYMGSAGADFGNISIHWDDTARHDSSLSTDTVFNSGTPRFTPAATWGNGLGVLRVDIVPITSNMATTLARENLVNNSYSFFLYPGQNSSTDGPDVVHTVGSAAEQKGIVLGRRCGTGTGHNPGYRCSASLRLGNTVSSRYFVRVQSYYNPVSLELNAQDNSGSPIEFVDTQAVIDATGRVNDVSRRIQVSVPLYDVSGYHEVFSILSASSLCKRIIGVPNASTINGNDGASSDDACWIDN